MNNVGLIPQLGYVAEAERHIGSPFTFSNDLTGNNDHFIQFCSDNRLPLPNTNFCQKKPHRSPGALLPLHHIGLRLTTLVSTTDDVD